MKDPKGKKILRSWPDCTRDIWPCPSDKHWLRTQPDSKKAPKLKKRGAAKFSTLPDGMWILYSKSKRSVDVMAVEVCNSPGNLLEKLARYSYFHFVTDCSVDWLKQKIAMPDNDKPQPRWKIMQLSEKPVDTLEIPVEALRVLYVLPDKLFDDWKAHGQPRAHEYYCRDVDFNLSNPDFKAFLGAMRHRRQFFKKKKNTSA